SDRSFGTRHTPPRLRQRTQAGSGERKQGRENASRVGRTQAGSRRTQAVSNDSISSFNCSGFKMVRFSLSLIICLMIALATLIFRSVMSPYLVDAERPALKIFRTIS